MRIYAPELLEEQLKVTIRVLVEFQGRKEYLWYSVPREYADHLTTERQDAFVVALLLLAMKVREDLYIDGVMSEKLFYNLTNYYMRMVASVIPTLHRVNLIPEGLDRTELSRGGYGVTTGFSAGVDSFSVLADHFYGSVPQSYKITHLLFNNVGSHGKGGRHLFEERYTKILPLTRKLGLPFIKIDSNLDELLQMNFQQTHTPRNVSAVLTLQKRIGKYYYASTYKYEDCSVRVHKDISCVDPMAVHLLSTEGTECISTGSQYSRVEKTSMVAGVEPSHQYLDICVRSSLKRARNCSVCWNCTRTLLTLEVLGKLDDYRNVFDLQKYGQVRHRYMAEVLSSKDPLHLEIIQLAQERGYQFPLEAKYYSWRRLVPPFVRGRIKKLAARQ